MWMGEVLLIRAGEKDKIDEEYVHLDCLSLFLQAAVDKLKQ